MTPTSGVPASERSCHIPVLPEECHVPSSPLACRRAPSPMPIATFRAASTTRSRRGSRPSPATRSSRSTTTPRMTLFRARCIARQGGARGAHEAPHRRDVARLLQARARPEVPRPPRRVLEGVQAGVAGQAHRRAWTRRRSCSTSSTRSTRCGARPAARPRPACRRWCRRTPSPGLPRPTRTAAPPGNRRGRLLLVADAYVGFVGREEYRAFGPSRISRCRSVRSGQRDAS